MRMEMYDDESIVSLRDRDVLAHTFSEYNDPRRKMSPLAIVYVFTTAR